MIQDKQTFISFAYLKAKPNKIETLRKELLALIEPTRKEEGCLDYVLFEVADNSGTFYMREAFKDEEAFYFHGATPYFKAFASKLDDLLGEPINIIRLNKISD